MLAFIFIQGLKLLPSIPWRKLVSLGFRGTERSTMDAAAGMPLNVARQVEFRLVEVEVPGRGGCCGLGNLKLSFGLTWPSVFHRRVVGCGCGESCFLSDCLLLR